MVHTRLESILSSNVAQLVQLLPGVREGDIEAIHDARVATRRARAALPLLEGWCHEGGVRSVTDIVARSGRALGRTRDLDVAIELTSTIERRVPAAAIAAVALRHVLTDARRTAIRKTIKALEQANVNELPERLMELRRRHGPLQRADLRASRTCADNLRGASLSAAHRVKTAIEHATGVYFPRRMHAARVELKKLRYSCEIAELTGLWRARGAMKTLRKSQALLGSVHDRQVLANHIDATSAGPLSRFAVEAQMLHTFLIEDIAALHAAYATRRVELVDLCSMLEHDLGRRASARATASLGASLFAVTASALYIALQSKTKDVRPRLRVTAREAIPLSRPR